MSAGYPQHSCHLVGLVVSGGMVDQFEFTNMSQKITKNTDGDPVKGPHQAFGLVILRKERKSNVLCNDALNTFYLLVYCVRHMVKDQSDSERGNSMLPHGLLFSIDSKGSFICTIPQTG